MNVKLLGIFLIIISEGELLAISQHLQIVCVIFYNSFIHHHVSKDCNWLTLLFSGEAICDRSSFKVVNGSVQWVPYRKYYEYPGPGTIMCNDEFSFNGTSDLVWCPNHTMGYIKADRYSSCLNNSESEYSHAKG